MRRRGRDSGKRAKTRHIMRWRTTYAAHGDISITKGELAVVPHLEMRAILEKQLKEEMEEWRLFPRGFGMPWRPARIIIGDLS